MLPSTGMLTCIATTLLSADAWLSSASRHTPTTQRNGLRVVAIMLTLTSVNAIVYLSIGFFQHKPAEWYRLGGTNDQALLYTISGFLPSTRSYI
jgi:hypothetical protein